MIVRRPQKVELVAYEPRRAESLPGVVGIAQCTVDGVHMRPLIITTDDGGVTLTVAVIDMFQPLGFSHFASFAKWPDPLGPDITHEAQMDMLRLVTDRARAEAQ